MWPERQGDIIPRFDVVKREIKTNRNTNQNSTLDQIGNAIRYSSQVYWGIPFAFRITVKQSQSQIPPIVGILLSCRAVTITSALRVVFDTDASVICYCFAEVKVFFIPVRY